MTTLDFPEVHTQQHPTSHTPRHPTAAGPREPGARRPRTHADGDHPRRTNGTLLLPPWTRAPLLGIAQPSVVLAVVAAAAILACAASSASLFLSSSSSGALHQIIGESCSNASYPTVTQVPAPALDVNPQTSITRATFPDPAPMERAVPQAMTDAGLPAPTRTIQSQPVLTQRGQTVQSMRMFYGDGAIDNVRVRERIPGDGVFLTTTASTILVARPGDEVLFGDRPVRVVGVYESLYDAPLPRYWCSYQNLEITPCPTCGTAPPPLVIFTDPRTLNAAYHSLGLAGRTTRGLTYQWIAPLRTDHLTSTDARRIIGQQNRAYATLGTSLSLQVLGDTNLGQLPTMADQAGRIRDGLHGPVVPIAIGGAVLALLLVGAAGSYWADRRAREVRLLASRGVGPGGLATKAALELVVPTVIGTALGWFLARTLVQAIGPSSDLDPSAPRTAAITAAIGFVAGMVLLSAVAGLRARNATERPVGARRSWAAAVPWEVVVIAGAAFCYLRLRGEDAVVLDHDVAQVNLLLVTFPLLFLVGVSVLVVRLFTLVLQPLRRRAGRWPAALYLAVSRITAAPVVSVTLLAAAAMPIAMVVYSGALTETSQYTVEAKTKVFTGNTVAVVSVDRVRRSPAVDRVATIVQRFDGARVDGQPATVLAIDPQTLARHAFWDDRFADVQLSTLMDRLTMAPRDGRVPALLVGDATLTNGDVQLGSVPLRIDVVAHPDVFPGTRLQGPLVVVGTANTPDTGVEATRYFELWGTEKASTLEAAMRTQGARTFTVHSEDKVVDVANYLAITWSFGYLEALAALVGVIAVAALLLYLATRQRTRAASYALSRRMGMSAGSHLRSLLCEMGIVIGVACLVGVALAWSAVLLVYSRMDIDRTRPPGPLLTVPVPVLVGVAVACVAVAVLAALFAHRSAQRTDVAEVLRLEF